MVYERGERDENSKKPKMVLKLENEKENPNCEMEWSRNCRKERDIWVADVVSEPHVKSPNKTNQIGRAHV